MILSIFINLLYLNCIIALPNYNIFNVKNLVTQTKPTQKSIVIPILKEVTQKFKPIITSTLKFIPIVTQKPISNITPQVTQTPRPIITSTLKNIPITSGNSATITYFTDSIFQCISGQPIGNAVAINPLLLGFTINDWNNLYKNADPSKIPWCNKTLILTVNGETFNATIIDTCNPTNDPSLLLDPKTNQIIGGPCDYNNVIDLHGENGLKFLNKISNGDDFYNGNGISWIIT
jgi:hypothetical protein